MVTEGSLHNTNIFHIMNGSKQFPYKLVKKCTIKHFLQKLLLWGKCGMLIYKANGLNRDNRLSWFKKDFKCFWCFNSCKCGFKSPFAACFPTTPLLCNPRFFSSLHSCPRCNIYFYFHTGWEQVMCKNNKLYSL